MKKRISLKGLLPGLTFSASGLSKDDGFWPEGRAWVYIGEPGEGHQTISLEYHLGKESRHCGIELSLNAVDGCRGIRLMLALPLLFSLWFTVERVPKWVLPGHYRESVLYKGEIVWQPEERSIGVRIHDWTICFSFWENVMEWNRTDPWWWQFNINILDLLLGRDKFSETDLETGTCSVPMPEGNYAAHYTVSEFEWRRPRWPWPRRKMNIDIEVDGEGGIPLPGKGENSWDCDDDAAYAIGMELVGSVEDAASHFAQGIVRDRVNRCGREIYP